MHGIGDRGSVLKKICCLVIAINPIHILSSISAILTRHTQDNVKVIILAQWPIMDDALTSELSVVMQSMVGAFPFVEKVRIVPYSKFNEMLGVSEMASFEVWLKGCVGVNHAEEIYYSHDVMGKFYQALSTVYGNARRICIGDGLGIVFERHVHLSFFEHERQSGPNQPSSFVASLRARLQLRTRLRRILRNTSSTHEKPADTPLPEISFKDFLPDEAVLILPEDESGNFLKKVPLTVCPKHTVLDVLEKCTESCVELKIYIRNLLDAFKGMRKYFLLTENLAEGNFIDFERETDMYCQMILDHCEPGSVLFIKSHPGETLPRNEHIVNRLAGKFEFVVLGKKFRRYPVEIWKDLINQSTVICNSYPALSLKYLYGKDVMHPMNIEFIETWFPQRRWAVMKNALYLNTEPIKKLPRWDGKSVLWAGSINKI